MQTLTISSHQCTLIHNSSIPQLGFEIEEEEEEEE